MEALRATLHGQVHVDRRRPKVEPGAGGLSPGRGTQLGASYVVVLSTQGEHRLDQVHLVFGPSTVSPQGSTGSGVAGTGSQKSDDGTGLADSWDHLSQPSLSDPPSSPSSSTEALLAPPTSLYIAHPRRQIRVSPKLTFTWIGQSTSFIQLEGVGILTDPVFSCVLCSAPTARSQTLTCLLRPFYIYLNSHKTIDSFLAPPRLCPCPCTLASLLSIQIVLVSHSHLDHLSPDVVVALGSSVEWVVPLGMRQWFRNLGVVDAKIHDLDWWESVELKVAVPGDGEGEETRKLNVTSTAAMHWSARSPLDTNQSLWSSYVVKGERDSYFHWCVRSLTLALEKQLRTDGYGMLPLAAIRGTLKVSSRGSAASSAPSPSRRCPSERTTPAGVSPSFHFSLPFFRRSTYSFTHHRFFSLPSRPRPRPHVARRRRQSKNSFPHRAKRSPLLTRVSPTHPQVHRDIGSKLSIGVHHSTWCLSDEHYLEPPKDLALARVAHGLTDDEFCVVPQGRTIVVASSASS